MERRAGLVLVVAALLVGCGQGDEAAGLETPANVLVLMVDALRADRLGVNGYDRPTTPHIDELARQGVSFTQAFSHSTWTKPSIATLFTSLYPGQHGIDQVALPGKEGLRSEILAGHFHTMAEAFRAAGYSTAAVVNQVHIRPRFGFDQGFDLFLARRGTGAPRLNLRLLGWLTERGPSAQPFFAYLHYLDVHWPYTKRKLDRSEELGPVELTREPPRSGKESVEDWAAALELPEDIEALKSRYDHEIAFTDGAIGELLAGLTELDLLEETIVVVTSDHGEAFLEHGELLHGHAPFDELIRVPLVVRLPARLRGSVSRVDVPVGLVDLLPSLLELAGIDPLPEMQGRSFVPLMRGETLRPRLIFAEAEAAVAVRSREHKLMRWQDGRQELYDLRVDPGEQHPRDADCGAECERLARRLTDFAAAMEASRARLQTEVVPLEDQDLEELRALGYLD